MNWISNRDTQLVGVVGIEDYQTWKQNFGATLASATVIAATVPEASSQISLVLTLVVGGTILSVARRYRRSGRGSDIAG
jgi:hypothetical protein